jgi:hypothetical protein
VTLCLLVLFTLGIKVMVLCCALNFTLNRFIIVLDTDPGSFDPWIRDPKRVFPDPRSSVADPEPDPDP